MKRRVQLPDCSFHAGSLGSGWMIDATYTQCRQCWCWYRPEQCTLNRKTDDARPESQPAPLALSN